jgi:hypothetical protein
MQTGQINRKQHYGKMSEFDVIAANAKFEQECWEQAKQELAYENIPPFTWTSAMATRIANRAQEIKIERRKSEGK